MIKEEVLRSKGWSEREIKSAMKILAEKREIFFFDRFASHIYWGALLLTIIGNLFICVALMPFLIYLSDSMVLIVVGVVGLAFGSLFNILLKDIEMTDPKHHIIGWLFLPTFVGVNLYVMIDIATRIKHLAGDTANLQSPTYISVAYALAFLIPFLVSKLAGRKS